ncbi:Retrovirus-related Pol polyprotein from transposon TNT 1-94 [Quillaja saponaria]|uniref:Retrovirus-related Pol polyprotein from transposon TNT 1-94 n=1 Tax=Quillaja saponaria TaxID=32244 RepID=A0AAD7QJW0_QUISA|nr:Retrovirus-related Pol polyprotein from transposon TNT 1-94 [Quillaja saponaria]
MALRPEYEAVRASLLHRDPLPTLDNDIQEIIFEESLSLDKSMHSKVALATTHPRSTTQKSGSQSCKNCNHTGHSFANYPTVECRYCHGIGHIFENCPTRPPRPKSGSFKPKNVSKTGSSSIATTTEDSTAITISDLEAISNSADSGDLNDNPSTSESTPIEPALAASPAPTSDNTTIRRSTQVRETPHHLVDYHCYFAILTYHEPHSYREASTDLLWQQAMNEELQALEKTHTWYLVDPSSGKTPIGCKWVYKIKTRFDGSIEHYKAHLVAKRYNQKYGIDYKEIFALMERLTSVSSLLVIAAIRKWKLLQMDVKNAFLNGDLQEEVYMHPFSWPFPSCSQRIMDIKTVSTPVELNVKLTPLDDTPLKDPTLYHQLVGSLVYLTIIRPDIAYAMHLVSQFMIASRTTHFAVVLRILHYVKGTLFHGLHFLAQSFLTLTDYLDVDWAGDPTDL